MQEPRHQTRLSADEFETEALAHLDSLYAVAMRLTRNGSDSEDLVQDTFVKAMRARARFVPGTNIRAWLLRIMTNTFINRYRRGGLERSVFESPDSDPLSDGWVGASTLKAMRDPESQALRPMLEREIQNALDGLPDEFRLAVMLADVEELSYQEAADAMGCPIGTVMSRLHRGRRLLKAKLYDVAREMGLVGPEEEIGEASSASPIDLASYRKQRAASS